MAATKGNKFWELREKHGRDKVLTPKELFTLAYEYKDQIDNNPEEIEDNKGTKNVNKIKLKRPYTWDGFEHYVFEKTGLARLEDYKKAEGSYKDFSDVVHIIDRMFKARKFEGAAIGIFKENIIARDLGLKDTTKNEVEAKVTTTTITAMTEEGQENIQKLLDEFKKKQ